MLSVQQLRSFYRRRIAIPVTASSLVLDVGSGDKPHWRADVLVDRFPDAEHAIQRSGSQAARARDPCSTPMSPTCPLPTRRSTT